MPHPTRRSFLAALSSTAVPLLISDGSMSAAQDAIPNPSALPLAGDPNILLQPDGSVVITWGVNAGLCTGWVEYGETAALGKVAKSGRFGMAQFDERVLAVRIPKIPAGSTIHFRTITVPLKFGPGVPMNRIQREAPVNSTIRSFCLPAAHSKQVKLAMWNDTHMKEMTVDALRAATAKFAPDFVVMNGDIHDFNRAEDLANACLRTSGGGISMPAWPMIYARGNHDMRGYFAGQLPQYLPPQASDGYYGIYRIGPLALIVLDTGEDALERKDYGQLTECQDYRQMQRDWLMQAIADPRLTSAPFRLLFCHIPLRWANPRATGYHAPWCADLFVPHLTKAGVQAVLSGHTHSFWHGEPTAEQPFHQITGGGFELSTATMTELTACSNKLNIRVSAVASKKPLLDLTLDALC